MGMLKVCHVHSDARPVFMQGTTKWEGAGSLWNPCPLRGSPHPEADVWWYTPRPLAPGQDSLRVTHTDPSSPRTKPPSLSLGLTSNHCPLGLSKLSHFPALPGFCWKHFRSDLCVRACSGLSLMQGSVDAKKRIQKEVQGPGHVAQCLSVNP